MSGSQETPPWQQTADALSKYTDGSQWLLNQAVYDSHWDEPCLHSRMPDIDMFADAYTTKILGRFYSKWWAPDCMGVDAFAQDWSGDLSQPTQDRPLLYINPPFDQVGRVVAKVAQERPDCVLILPVWPRWWRATLTKLPVKARRTLPHRPDLFLPGPQTPQAGRRAAHAPRYRVEALYVVW